MHVQVHGLVYRDNIQKNVMKIVWSFPAGPQKYLFLFHIESTTISA